MDKMQMAHEWFISSINNGKHVTIEQAWCYADAMQAEADKRKPIGLPDALKKKWQPDWSQAPEWAKWWAITKYGQGHWFLSEPKVIEESWVRATRECKQAPSFNYQGDWQKSLRERPE